MSIDPVSLGIQAALMAAQMALGASRKIEGPRLDDLSVTLADYGTPLNYFKGACRFDGPPIFWKEDLREIKTRSKTKGGKYNDYRYTGSWANAIAAQAIDGVTRIFMDRHLVYDRTGAGPVTPFSIGYTQRTGKTGSGSRDVNINLLDHLRIYLGSETQMPDPRMLQEVEVRKGVGFCPAHRGLAYVLFEEIPLDKFGNRLPQLSVWAVSSATPIYPFETFSSVTPALNNLSAATFSPDFSKFMWAFADTYEIWDVAARTRIVAGTFPVPIPYTSKLGLYNDGRILITSQIDLYVLKADGLGVESITANIFPTAPMIKWQRQVGVFQDGNGVEHWASTGQPTVLSFWVDGNEFKMVDLTGTVWVPANYFVDSYGDVWAVGRAPVAGATVARFYRIVDTGARPGSPSYITVTGLPPSAGGYPEMAAVHFTDGTLDQFVFHWDLTALYAVDIDTGAINATATPTMFPYVTDSQFRNCAPGANSIWLNFTEISLADLSVLRTVVPGNWTSTGADGIIYDPVNHALISAPVGFLNITWRYLDRISGAGVTLRTVVEHVSNLCGIDPSVLDASALMQSVPGYKWTRGSGKDVIEPLLDLYAADCRPHGFGVQFVNRGVAAGALIVSDSFAMVDGDEPLYAFTTPGGSDVPKALTLAFSDISAEYQTNNIYSKRPLDAVDGRGEITIDMTPLSITPAAARPLADRLLRQYWIARKGWTHALTAEYIDLEPGDVRTLDLEGVVHTAKLLSMAVDADGAIALEWQRDDPSVHVLSTTGGAAMAGHQPSTMLIPRLSRGLVLDVPLAFDVHDQSVPFLYYAAAPYAAGGYWPGVEFAVSDSGVLEDYAQGWATVVSGDSMDWGHATAPLVAALPWIFDRAHTLNLRMQIGTLIGATEAAVLADASINLILLQSGAGWEFIQFTTPTLQGDGSYNLTGLLRGCRGTEQFITGHATGDLAIVADAQLFRRDVGAGEIGDTDFYRPVTQGRNLESAYEQSLTFTAAAHRPYSPVHGVLLRDTGSNNWTIAATRRSRIGGNNILETAVPLGEVSQSWQADIMNGSAVKRTLTGTALPLVYTSAQQVADWGANQNVLTVNLYQMSPALSLRGFPLNIAA